LPKVSFALLIHSHQPVGNFDHVIEQAYHKSYLPFLEALDRHPAIRMSLHFTGSLLEWLEQHHPEYFALLKKLTARRQIEMVGGGYYEPILPSIPDTDKHAQIRKLADYIQQHFGAEPRGAWVAERVWEPSLAKPLAEAGVGYVVLDDTHFLAAGLAPGELHTSYITEESGASLRLVPSLKSLRYTIPFRDVSETIAVLRQGEGWWGSLFAMGDDCEKFGVWPGTYDHCYTNGWLERFLQAIEKENAWLETTTLGDYLDAYPPSHRIYLPTASYPEMMEWALPTAASQEFKKVHDEVERLPDGARYERFLRGGLWRNFMSKYAESNQINKLVLHTSARYQKVRKTHAEDKSMAAALWKIEDQILSAQCNDAYWHGVFGGLYAPHLRSELLRSMVEAESGLDAIELTGDTQRVRRESCDLDIDGHSEILLSNNDFGLLLKPSDGGTIASLRYKPERVELVNSLMRRPEAYHDQVRQKIEKHDAPKEGPASIHDRVVSKEPNLGALLRYDHYPRHVFRTYAFPAWKTWEDFDYLRLDENGDLAGGEWRCVPDAQSDGSVLLERDAQHRVRSGEIALRARKTIETSSHHGVWRLDCQSSLATASLGANPLAVGIEMVFNLLAPNAHDRYFESAGERYPLEFRGKLSTSPLLLVDEWQQVKITLHADPQPEWWVVPIETISQSESGFERVYQGSAVMAVWKSAPSGWSEMKSEVRVEISSLAQGG
jgi:4-alpha-glucanotransferase